MIINKKIYFFGNIETLLLSLIAITIPLKLNLGNISIIISVFYAFILLLKGEVPLRNFKGFYFLMPLFLFLIAVLSALFSKDISEGFHQLEKLLLMLLLPFIFSAFKERGLKVFKIIYTYAFGVTLAVIILLIFNLLKILYGAPTKELFFFDFTSLYDQHPVYFSTNILLAIFFLIHFFLVKKCDYLKLKYAFILITLNISGLIFCASKAVIFCFLILLLLYAIIFRKNFSHKTLLLAFGLLLIGALSIAYIPTVKERFIEGLTFNSKDFMPTNNLSESKKFSYQEKDSISDLELRLIFFKIGIFHTLNDEKLLFGYGLGDVQHYLDYYYMTYNLAPNWYEGYNLHNQYLQFLVTFGIFGYLLFILYLLYSLYYSNRKKNIIHLLFIVMILFVFIFEVYMARNKGIVFLFFFNTLFLTQKIKFESSNFRDERNTKLSRWI